MNPENFFAILPDYVSRFGARAPGFDLVATDLPRSTGVVVISGVMCASDYSEIAKQIDGMAKDASVEQLFLIFNSPGGSVLGISDAVEAINRFEKPIFAIAAHICASAAYWIASQCNEIWLASDTAVVGSVGVIATHVDSTKLDENFGFSVTEIVSGTYKNLTSPSRPFDDAALAYYQKRVGEIFALFVRDVSAGRPQVDEKKLIDFGGADFLGQAAIDAGLADKRVNLREVFTMAYESGFAASIKAIKAVSKAEGEEENKDKKEGEDEEAEGEESEEDKDKKKKDGEEEAEDEDESKKEQARIMGIIELAGVSLGKTVMAAIKNGKTVEQFAVVAMRELKTAGLYSLSNVGPNGDALALLKGHAPTAAAMSVSAGDKKTGSEVQAAMDKAAAEVNQKRRRH